MHDSIIVLLKIVSVFLVMLVGWIARRRAYLTKETTRALSRLLVDIVFPAMVFTAMLKTVNPDVLRDNGFIPLLGAAVIVIACLVALLVMPFFCQKGKRATAVFLVTIPNWIFFPLPIVEELFGDEGIRAVLLYNVGAMLMMWTLGIWILRRARHSIESIKGLAMNPGLLATLAGIILAILCPAARTLETIQPVHASVGRLSASAVIQALTMIGSLTIPMSLLITGAHLGGLKLADHRPTRELTGVILSRLVLAPVITVMIVLLVERFGIVIPAVPRLTGYLIACMPVAITSSIITERFGGDTVLSARAIFYSTLWSIITVPICYYCISRFGL